MEGDSLSHLLIGGIFCLFGLKWACEYTHFWINPRRCGAEDRPLTKAQKLATQCQQLCIKHPVEGSLKLIATAIGLIGTIVANLPDNLIVSPKVVHATIYLFFALSGLVDVLTFYFPRNVTKGLASLALAQSFFAEGFLFMCALPEGNIINNILAAIVWITALTVGAELIWPDLKLFRAFITILHGGWMAHMVRFFHLDEPLLPAKIALAFSWHIAAAFGITIIIVVIVRSCVPKVIIHEQPQEIPIYDYCNEPHNI